MMNQITTTGAGLSLMVVRTRLPRVTPDKPISRINRPEVQRDRKTLQHYLAPDLADAVSREVLGEHLGDRGLQAQALLRSRRQAVRGPVAARCTLAYWVAASTIEGQISF